MNVHELEPGTRTGTGTSGYVIGNYVMLFLDCRLDAYLLQ